MTRQQLDAPAPQLRAPDIGELRADVDQGHAQTGVGEIDCGVIGRVIVGEHDRVRAGANRIAVDVALGGGCQHHTRAVVVSEHKGPFTRSCREHDPPRPYLPQPLADPAAPFAVRQVVGTTLQDRQVVVVVVTEGGGACQQPHLLHRFEIGHH